MLGKDSERHPTHSGPLAFAVLLVPSTSGQALGWSPGLGAALGWPRKVPRNGIELGTRNIPWEAGGLKESLKKLGCKEMCKRSKEWIRASLALLE